jgi:hypothetical protein
MNTHAFVHAQLLKGVAEGFICSQQQHEDAWGDTVVM